MSGDSDPRRMIDHVLCRRTRRHFFADCGVGLGAMALASLSRGEPAAGAMAEPDGDPPRPARARRGHGPRRQSPGGPAGPSARAGQERHLSVHGRRPQPARAVRLQAPAPEIQRPADPGLVHPGAPVRVHGYLHQGASQAAGDGPPVRQARPVGGMGLGALAAPGRGRRRPDDRQIGGDRCVQPCAGQAVRQHGDGAVRPAEHGLVGHLRHRQRVGRPARLRGAAIGPARAAGRGGQLGERLSALGLPGRAAPRAAASRS